MSKPIHWLTLFAVVLSVAVGLYLWRASETPAPQITEPTTASPPKEPAIRYPIEAAGPAQEADEPLPALADSDKPMQDALANLMKNRTSFVIAHRLSTIQRADAIIVLERGRIVEVGRHDELLDRPAGAYALLYQMQLLEGRKAERRMVPS